MLIQLHDYVFFYYKLSSIENLLQISASCCNLHCIYHTCTHTCTHTYFICSSFYCTCVTHLWNTLDLERRQVLQKMLTHPYACTRVVPLICVAFSFADTSPSEPPDSSPMFPEGLNLEVEEQELFMKANFESLSAADADKFFGTTHSLADANCSRLSISTQFLSKSLESVGGG